MKRKSLEQLGALQRAVVEIVWELGEASVHDVLARMPRGRKPAYTTILTVMQKLEKAGWLAHRQQGRSYVYFPAVSRADAGSRSLRATLRQLFKGDIRAFMQQLIAEDSLSQADLVELRRMIDRKRKEKQDA